MLADTLMQLNIHVTCTTSHIRDRSSRAIPVWKEFANSAGKVALYFVARSEVMGLDSYLHK